MAKDKFREDIERIRMKLMNRIDMLTQHEKEYNKAKSFDAANLSKAKASQLYMVLNDLDKALK